MSLVSPGLCSRTTNTAANYLITCTLLAQQITEEKLNSKSLNPKISVHKLRTKLPWRAFDSRSFRANTRKNITLGITMN